MRFRKVKRQQSSQASQETLEKILENTEKQIISYEKELEFLKGRILEGDQLDNIQEMQVELKWKQGQKEKSQKYLKETQRNIKKSEKRLKLTLNSNGKKRITTLTRESKYLTKRLDVLQVKIAKNNRAYNDHLVFSTKLEDRYIELVDLLREQRAMLFHLDSTGKVYIKNLLPKKENPKIRKKKITQVSQIWKDDVPNKFEETMNSEVFEKLRKKVIALRRGDIILEKQHKYKMKKLSEKVESLFTEETNMGKQEKLHEKDKELELLMKLFDKEKRGMKHKALLPIEEIITVKRNTNREGHIIMNVGICKTLIKRGEHESIGKSSSIKLRALKFWVEKNRIVGIQSQYTPHFNAPIYGKSKGKPLVFGLYKNHLVAVECGYSKKEMIYLAFRTQGDEDISFGSEGKKEYFVNTIDFPNYLYIRSVYIYGDNLKISGIGFHIMTS